MLIPKDIQIALLNLGIEPSTITSLKQLKKILWLTVESRMLLYNLDASRHNQSCTAKALGISLRSVFLKTKRMGLEQRTTGGRTFPEQNRFRRQPQKETSHETAA